MLHFFFPFWSKAINSSSIEYLKRLSASTTNPPSAKPLISLASGETKSGRAVTFPMDASHHQAEALPLTPQSEAMTIQRSFLSHAIFGEHFSTSFSGIGSG